MTPPPVPITPHAAEQAIKAHWPEAPIEQRPLEQCTGQTLRQEVYAERDNPPYDRVCMDGIAINSTAAARGQRSFAIEAMQRAGAPSIQLRNPDNAIEVMTGSILPQGADCVVPMEEYDPTPPVAQTLNSGAHPHPASHLAPATSTDQTPPVHLKPGTPITPSPNIQRP